MNTYLNQELPSITIIGVSQTFYLNDPDAKQAIGEFWGHFFVSQTLAKIPHKIDEHTMYGIYTDYNASGSYSLIIGAPVTSTKEIPAGMVSKAIPAAHYAVFSAKGSFNPSLAQTWATIWQTKLDRAFTSDFEVYDEKSTNNDQSIVNIYIAVK
jgi:predicted transcriptional regulator YdeE